MKIKTLLLAALSTVALSGCIRVIGPNEHYVSKYESIGTVTAVQNCYAGKYYFECNVQLDGGRFYRMSFNNWPGKNISVGDELGYTYRIGDDIVEKWKTNKRISSIKLDSSCNKHVATCYYPK
ncbi:hypothetical protein [Stenotrophomonas phage RAS14]